MLLFFISCLLAAQNNKYQGSFLRKDDPKINVLMQQAELLSSLALKVNAENTDQSLENAWKVRTIFMLVSVSVITVYSWSR